MTKQIKLGLTLFSVFLFSEISAQNVYFTGLGRALVTAESLSDKTKEAAKLKSSNGYTMFDLGIYGKASEVLRGGVILRTRNEYGGFFADGASLSFRQMQLEGIINKHVKYELGDIYLTQTPYTIWNNDSVDYKYEANLFSMRRDIINYENFYVGNAWRMQGFNTKAKITFAKGIESIGLRAFGGRTRETNFLTIPDRYFHGGRIDLTQSKYFRIGANAASISDIAGTVKAADIDYNNSVFTADYTLTLDKLNNFKFALMGESGISGMHMKRTSDTLDKKINDYFYEGTFKVTYKPYNVNIGVGFRNVGFNFNSPMAQTRRLASPNNVAISNLGTLNNGITGRAISVFDPFAQEMAMYNQSISTTLMQYYTQYTIVEPYGKATPNRTGLTIAGDIQQKDKIYNASFEFSKLSEIASEGDKITFAKRKFQLIRAGFVLNINKLIKMEKTLAINGGIKMESSSRDGVNKVKLNNSLIDLGLDLEVFKSLHLLGGAKLFTVKGNEIQSGRDALNEINGFAAEERFNQTQNVIATGIRYDYDKAGCFFSMHYHMVTSSFKDGDDNFNVTLPNKDYKLNQLFAVFGLKF